MKQKHTFLFLYFLFFTGITLFVSCQTDEKPTEIHHSNLDMSSKRITLEEFSMKAKAMEKYNTIINKRLVEISDKVAYNEIYDFSIDTSEILMIEKGGFESYTFPVHREKNSDLIENLILNKQKDGSYSASLIKYNLTEDDKQLLQSHKLENLTGKVKAIELNIEKFNTRGKGLQYCKTWYFPICTYGISFGIKPHVAGPECGTITDSVTYTFCYPTEQEYMDNSFVSPGYPGNDNGGGGGGTIDPGPGPEPENPELENPVVTEPILTDHPKDSPCKRLNKLSATEGYAGMINYLKGKALGTKEYAWVYKYFPNSTNFAPPTVAGYLPSDPTLVDLNAFTGVDWWGAFHNHTDPLATGAVQMFSPKDIEWLFIKGYQLSRLEVASRNNVELFLGLVVQNGVYSLKIKDWTKFRMFGTPAVFDDFKTTLENLYQADGHDASKTTCENTFLKVLQMKNVGVGLYEQDEEGKWSELELNPQGNNATPVKKPCTE